MPLHSLCPSNELVVGEKKLFNIEGHSVIVYHLESGYYATQSKCSHLFKSMAKGKVIDDCNIECPLHKAQFDIRTGEVVRWANFPPGVQLLNIIRGEKALNTYTVLNQNNTLFIDIE